MVGLKSSKEWVCENLLSRSWVCVGEGTGVVRCFSLKPAFCVLLCIYTQCGLQCQKVNSSSTRLVNSRFVWLAWLIHSDSSVWLKPWFCFKRRNVWDVFLCRCVDLYWHKGKRHARMSIFFIYGLNFTLRKNWYFSRVFETVKAARARFFETCRFLNGVITGFTVTRVCPANTEGLVEQS